MTSATIRVGLIGEHISRSRFGRAMRMMCDLAGLPFEFELIDAAEHATFDFNAVVADLQTRGWSGTAVTHPFKGDAATFVGKGMKDEARPLGAANLIRFGEPVEGFNTDYTGFLSAWRYQMKARPVGRVAMAGAGGVARAVAPALARLGAGEIVIWDLDPERADALADMVGPIARSAPADAAPEAIHQADGLVNCSPVGMDYLPGSAFPPDTIGRQAWAFDAIYVPTKTAFLETCREKGLATMSGFELFRHMIMDSFEMLTGIVPDPVDTLPRLEAFRPA